jgi:hypothetical protein
VMIEIPDQIIISAVDVTNPSGSASGSILMTVSGGTEPLYYSIDGGSEFYEDTMFTNLESGTYYINIVDDNDCYISFGGNPLILEELKDSVVITGTEFVSGETICYGAYQTITIGGDDNPVDFSFGSSTNLIAGTSITFLPGVHIEQASYLSATITTDSTFCDDYSGSLVVAKVDTKKSDSETGDKKDEDKKIMKMKSLKVFPNPNNGKFNVEFTGLLNSTEFVIYNFLGSIIYKGKLDTEKTAIDLSKIQKGLYFLKVISNPKPLIQEILIN